MEFETFKVESQNFLDPVLAKRWNHKQFKPRFSIKLGFRNTELS